MRRPVHPIVKELRAARLARKLSYDKFGELSGYHANHIWSIEHGKQGVRIEVLADLAQALGGKVKIEWESVDG
jgi:transcriptional regulator with XRE-family HTH domain